MPRPSKYPEEFRRDAVALVWPSPGRPLREIGRELGVNHETLRGWVNAAKRAEQGATGGVRDGERTAEERDERSPSWNWRRTFSARQPPILPKRWADDPPLPVHL